MLVYLKFLLLMEDSTAYLMNMLYIFFNIFYYTLRVLHLIPIWYMYDEIGVFVAHENKRQERFLKKRAPIRSLYLHLWQYCKNEFEKPCHKFG